MNKALGDGESANDPAQLNNTETKAIAELIILIDNLGISYLLIAGASIAPLMISGTG